MSLSKKNKKRNRRSSAAQTARRVSNNQQLAAKQPLGLDMSLGNGTSASTVRLFRQEPSNSLSKENNGNPEDQMPTLSKTFKDSALSALDENAPPSSQEQHVTGSLSAAAKKEHRSTQRQQGSTKAQPPLYKAIVSPAIHDILSKSTDCNNTRDALARFASAWRNLENVDASAAASLLQVLSQQAQTSGLEISHNEQGDKSISNYPIQPSNMQQRQQQQQQNQPLAMSQNPPQPHQDKSFRSSATPSSTTSFSPSSSTSSSASTTSPKKLFLAQNNPHLKSHHRRRQSAIVPGERGRDDILGYDAAGGNNNIDNYSVNGYKPISMMVSSVPEEMQQQQRQQQRYRHDDYEQNHAYGRGYGREDDEDYDALERKMPDYAPESMPAVASMAEALYGRWLEGMKTRWARMG